MMILSGLGVYESFRLFRHAESWALQRLISFNCASGDLRWAMVLLAFGSFTCAWSFARQQFTSLAQSRERRKRCFAGRDADADTMVAAGGN